MNALYFFAFVSGLVTIFAPCIWPILPIILAGSATGGHRKPLGITLGVIISFGFLTLSLSYIIKIIPFDPNLLRYIAAFIIAFLGLVLIVPKLSGILEGWVSRLTGKLQMGNTGSGFGSGFLIGIALGVIWAPCAGPIFATIAALAATQKVNTDVILVTVFYVIGIGIPLFIFATLGRFLFTKTRMLNKYTGIIQKIFGVIMIVTAFLIVTNYDKTISARLLNFFPSYSNGLTALESVDSVRQGLNTLSGNTSNSSPSSNGLFNTNYPAPNFVGITKWLQTSDGKPLTIEDLKGKVVLVDFWTYTCINCIRTLPYVTSWYDKYKDKGFVVVGVHTPEFAFEKNTKNVEDAINQYGIHYPVAQDNDYATWNNYNNQYWPAEYLIDANGSVRRTHFGEGEYDQMEMAIQKLLEEAGKSAKMPLSTVKDQTSTQRISQETYLGSSRMQYLYPNGGTMNGTQNFTLEENIPINTFSFGGTWDISDEYATAGRGARILYNFYADKVFLVMNGGRGDAGNTLGVRVLLDGTDLTSKNAGSDVKFEKGNDATYSHVDVDQDRLYNLVDLHGNPGKHTLEIIFGPRIKAFAFTFG